MLSFDNTETAFRGHSNSELRKALWMYRLISSQRFVQFCKPLAKPLLQIGGPFKWLVKTTFFQHFCGGESIANCDDTVAFLAKYKVHSILDFSVEGKDQEADFERTTGEILQTQERAGMDLNIPFNVFKITGIARFQLLEKVSAGEQLSVVEQDEFERVKNRVERIFKKAVEVNKSVMIDAEETWIQPAIDALCLDGMRKYNRERPQVFNTIQLYRADGLKMLQQLTEKAKAEGFYVGVKLVRGAYMEKERERAAAMGLQDPIQPDYASTNQNFDAALRHVIEHIDSTAVCAGTHNENSALLLTRLMQEKNLPKNHPHIWFSQLLGMSEHISFNLAEAGYNVAKYVPYGPVQDVLPYLIRRAEENTSVAGQTGRELSLITKEIERRKAAAKR
ncbi:MAG: proline dehydrogenase family protein [Bacteroidia bacterium]|nr:proline dehydrogenase family protein [Bacteroidia bacterium]MCC6767918.1 proline dehydrogenase family protein [Bacteroidia bacterium]